MKKLYLVDVSSMFFRAFYAIRPLTSPSGMPVNAIYGFLSMTVKLLRDIHPDYLAFCFDRPEPSFRKDLDARYKANRTEMPADLVPQVPYIRILSEALGIPCLDRLGFEADDIIGTLTKMGRDHGLEVVIVSGDKDFAQLVKPYVSMYDTMKDVRYDEAGVVEKWGIEPKKFIDYLAIVGDSSDNVPGVSGIGPKGAQKLLAEYSSLEEIYENLEQISSASTRKKLEADKDEAFLSRKLVSIVCDMPLGISVDELRLKPIVREDLHKLLAEFDFKSFARTLLGESSPSAPAASAPVEAVSMAVAAAAPSQVEHVQGSVSHVLNPQGNETGTIKGSAGAVNSFVRRAPPQTGVAAPTVESSRGAPTISQVGDDFGPITEQRLDLSGLESWLQPGEETWALQTERGTFLAQRTAGASSGRGYAIAEVAAYGAELGAMVSAKKLRFKGFNIKDFCKQNHVSNPHVLWDQMLAAYVIRAGNIESALPLFTLYNGEALPDLPSPSQLLTAHLRLETHLSRKLAALGSEKVLYEIEQPLVPILLSMETTGILIDSGLLSQQSSSLAKDLAVLEKEIHKEAGEPFNIGSPKQLGHVLFDKLKMPPGKKTKTGYSTDNEVLEALAKEFPITSKILQWRELSKLKSTYVDALPLLADKSTGRVHTTFNQALTSTGRLSSTNPNLQNIPIRSERGTQIRRAFIANSDHCLISADYSQIELRILAHITGDAGLMNAFESDLDIHAATASEIFDVKLPDVTSEMRRKAKAVNFGLAYGQGAFGLAETLRISRKESAEIIERYFKRFPGVKTYMTDTVEEAKQKGYVETVFGRRRYLDELYSGSGMIRKFGERAAINAPIQGTASDLVKLAMIKVGDPTRAKMLLQVHDELIFEAENHHVDETCLEVGASMENVAKLKVPLKVNTGAGANWEEAHS